MTIDCLNDVIKTYGVNYEVIVVNDGSREPISKVIPKMFPSVRLISNPSNLGFAKTCNNGIRAAKHDLICLLNNDTRLPNPEWLRLMVAEMDNVDMTSVAGGRMDKNWNYQPGEVKKKGESFTYLAGWAIMFKRVVIEKIGLIPEDFNMGFFEDVLFCHRAKKTGFKMGLTENTRIQHLYHKTFTAEGYNISEEYMKKRQIFLNIIKRKG
jgi:GT2 family glycosyltransferase